MPHKRNALITTSTASMVHQFLLPSIELLIEMGYNVDVATNFIKGSTCTKKEINELLHTLKDMQVDCYQIDYERNVAHIGADIRALKQLNDVARGRRKPIGLKKYHYISSKTNPYTLVHSHSPIGGAVGRIAAKINHVKAFYTAHGFHFYIGAPLFNWMVYYPIEKLLSCITDTLITINKEDYHRAKRKFHAKRTVYIPGIGVDVEKFANVKIDREEKRRSLGLKPDDIMLLSVGELSRRKNHIVVLRALKKLQDKRIHYFVAGQGMLEETLKKTAESLNIEKQVHLIGFRRDVGELCKVTDLFVFPSLQEGLPVALMEAIACGTICIASDIRGNRDLIRGSASMLVSPDSPQEWADAIEYMSNTTDRKEGLAFDKPAVVNELQAVYAERQKILLHA